MSQRVIKCVWNVVLMRALKHTEFLGFLVKKLYPGFEQLNYLWKKQIVAVLILQLIVTNLAAGSEFLLSALTRRLTPAQGVFRSTEPPAQRRPHGGGGAGRSGTGRCCPAPGRPRSARQQEGRQPRAGPGRYAR